MKEALFYKKEKATEVSCYLCNHHCRINDGAFGICRVRKNEGGILYSLNYGELAAAGVDPIEKKPLYHFYPATFAYSIASVGCNFKCDFCQNWQISQDECAKDLGLKASKTKAENVVKEAERNRCLSISYTYTEPTIFFEFAYECAQLAKKKGLYNSFVTNGYMSKEPLEAISPYLDAANVDLKSYRDDFYRKFCKASLKPVLETIALMKKLNIWVEITTLVIPGCNDRSEELEDIVSFIYSLDKNIPWHISRCHPDYKLTKIEPTPLSTLKRAYEIGKVKGLKFIYIGNIHTDFAEDTYCPSCKKAVIERSGFVVNAKNIKEGKCGLCGAEIAGRGL